MKEESKKNCLKTQHSKNKKKDPEKILEEIIVENFPKMGNEIITQVQETQGVPNRKTQGKTPQDTY